MHRVRRDDRIKNIQMSEMTQSRAHSQRSYVWPAYEKLVLYRGIASTTFLNSIHLNRIIDLNCTKFLDKLFFKLNRDQSSKLKQWIRPLEICNTNVFFDDFRYILLEKGECNEEYLKTNKKELKSQHAQGCYHMNENNEYIVCSQRKAILIKYIRFALIFQQILISHHSHHSKISKFIPTPQILNDSLCLLIIILAQLLRIWIRDIKPTSDALETVGSVIITEANKTNAGHLKYIYITICQVNKTISLILKQKKHIQSFSKTLLDIDIVNAYIDKIENANAYIEPLKPRNLTRSIVNSPPEIINEIQFSVTLIKALVKINVDTIRESLHTILDLPFFQQEFLDMTHSIQTMLN